eukprot:GHVS01065556.1.p1 GENE.GHVS01065556.1~~GHVS01065556.1.p1  ORF type:complete len:218 (-),score=56.41 GHVS01065556.1:610-1185(-)
MTASSLSSRSLRFHSYFDDIYLPMLRSIPLTSSTSSPSMHQLDRLGNCLLDYFLPTNGSSSSPDVSSSSPLKVLAMDFDLTMTNKHSGGILELSSPSSSSFLSSSLCPSFVHFAQLAHSRGLKICVVTFGDSKSAEAKNRKHRGGANRWVGGDELVRLVVKHSSSGGEIHIDKVFGYLPWYVGIYCYVLFV